MSHTKITDEMVERAARAIWWERYGTLAGHMPDDWTQRCSPGTVEDIRKQARAALEAALTEDDTVWEYGESTDPNTPKPISGGEAWSYYGPTYPIRRRKAGPWEMVE